LARYRPDSDWTATFSSAVSGLGLYANQWNPGIYTFNQSVAILSGFSSPGVSLVGGNVLTIPAGQLGNGILQFSAPVSSFSVTSGAGTTSNNRVTFAAPVPLETDALPILGSAAFMAGGLWWKKKRAGAKALDLSPIDTIKG
jgi:hypothetical protein